MGKTRHAPAEEGTAGTSPLFRSFFEGPGDRYPPGLEAPLLRTLLLILFLSTGCVTLETGTDEGCSDGEDNDGDGLFDCEDVDCRDDADCAVDDDDSGA